MPARHQRGLCSDTSQGPGAGSTLALVRHLQQSLEKLLVLGSICSGFFLAAVGGKDRGS